MICNIMKQNRRKKVNKEKEYFTIKIYEIK